MPTTVNGVGTRYVGKRNAQSRTGVCRACNANTRLQSYDTGLWFVVLFIPVIPLGRKRIVDQCSCCGRHWVSKLAAYEMSKQLGVSGAMVRYRQQPSPEAALELHGCLLNFHQFNEADAFRQVALEQHSESAALHAGLAAQLAGMGRASETAPLFEKALALRPDLPEARVGVARLRMANREWDKARDLLRFLEVPGAGQLYSLEPLETLAINYQRDRRHAEVLELCKCIVTELPNVGQVRKFRKFVAVSEKALGIRQSILPKRVFSLRVLFARKGGTLSRWRRRLAFAAVVVGAVAIGMAAVNAYWRQHRVVYVMNESGAPCDVVIDGTAVPRPGPHTTVQLAEGPHHVKIAGPIDAEFDFEMHTDYCDRWTKDPIWVIDVDGGLALYDQTLHYAANPRPGQSRLLLGSRTFFFPHVDYAFTTPPQSLPVDKNAGEVTKTHVGSVEAPASALFRYALDKGDISAAFCFGEARLRRNPADRLLLEAYVEAAQTADQGRRARDFLKAGLGRRPVEIAWHRAYQGVCQAGGHDPALVADYDALLRQEPGSAVLLYLRGRVDRHHAKGREFFQRACAADPKLVWPWMALAYDAAAMGDWPLCRSLVDKSIGLKSDEPSHRWLRHTARLATGDTAAMESECRVRLEAGQPGENDPALLELCEVLIARGEAGEARQAIAAWKARLPLPLRSSEMVAVYDEILSYMLGDLAAIQAAEPRTKWRSGADFRLQVLVAAGRPQDAAQDAALQNELKQPWNALAVSLAFSLAGNQRAAAVWRDKACAALQIADTDSRSAAALLRGDKPPTKAQLDDVLLMPGVKALLAAVLARRFPENKEELAALAGRLDVRRLPPYQLVRKAIQPAP